MAYRELPQPTPQVACLWIRDPEPESRTHRVLPDACVDVVWVDDDRLIVAGPTTGPALSEVPAASVAMGVRFRVGAAGGALGVPASELLDAGVPLEDVWGAEAARIAERVAAAPTPETRLIALAAEVGARLTPAVDRLVRAAAAGAARPGARVDQLGAKLGITERQLRRRFADAVGYGPKTLQRVLRFQRFLALARQGPADLARLALDAGYADQAHLTRECRRLSGVTPAALLAAGAGPAGEGSDPFNTRGFGGATIAA
jgi:AraC-like DNA-binding protein